MAKQKSNLLITASTFPRWPGDSVPPFVQDFAQHVSHNFKRITVVVPHYMGSKTREKIGSNIYVRRFWYFWPARQENIVYNGGGISKIKKTPLYALKLIMFCTSLLCSMHSQYVKLGGSRIINAHWLVPQGTLAVALGKLVGAKVIVTVHGGDVFALNGKFMRKIKRWTLKNADSVVVNSSATQRACLELFDDREYPIIPMGVDVRDFKPKANVARKPSAPLRILFVGRVVDDKGVIYLCRAVNKLNSQRLKVHLDIIGDGPGLDRLRHFVDKNNAQKFITIHGGKNLTQLPGFYRQADVFVGPSIQGKSGWKEAFGVVFAEALACGTPVIATDVGGTRDIVKDGKNGFIVPQKDSEAIAEKLLLIYKDPQLALKLGRHGSKFIRDNFGWDSVTKLYVDQFRQLGIPK